MSSCQPGPARSSPARLDKNKASPLQPSPVTKKASPTIPDLLYCSLGVGNKDFFKSSQIRVKSNSLKKFSSQICVKSNNQNFFSSQIWVKSNTLENFSSQIRVKSNNSKFVSSRRTNRGMPLVRFCHDGRRQALGYVNLPRIQRPKLGDLPFTAEMFFLDRLWVPLRAVWDI